MADWRRLPAEIWALILAETLVPPREPSDCWPAAGANQRSIETAVVLSSVCNAIGSAIKSSACSSVWRVVVVNLSKKDHWNFVVGIAHVIESMDIAYTPCVTFDMMGYAREVPELPGPNSKQLSAAL